MSYKLRQDETEYMAEALSSIMDGRAINAPPQKRSRSKGRSAPRTNRRVSYKPFLAVMSVLIIGGIATFAGLKLTNESTQNSPDTAKVLGSVTAFTPYNVNTLPEGMTINAAEASYQAGVLMMPVLTASGQVISISQQAVPPEFANTTPMGSESIETTYGKGGVSSNSERTALNIISTNGVFIIISAPPTVSTETLKQLAHSLKPY